jgi:DNA-binding beta-propeller fold protein YncE
MSTFTMVEFMVADYANHRIQIFDPQGEFIAKFGEGGSADGQLSGPEGVGVDKESGAVYVADTGNNRIQLLNANNNCSSTCSI